MQIAHAFEEGRSSAPLGQYRLYFLDSEVADQLISDSFEFESGSDAAAMATAEAVREGRPVELWRGASKLASWPAGRR